MNDVYVAIIDVKFFGSVLYETIVYCQQGMSQFRDQVNIGVLQTY